jgi:uncharacterized membrane protein
MRNDGMTERIRSEAIQSTLSPVTPESSFTAATPARLRIESVDVVRGIIMILMALDHVRDFFGSLAVSPTNLATTTPELFLTRWITHICAPVFFLLTGTGAYLALRRRSRSEPSRFLLTRGLWLIFLELVVVRFVMQFNIDYRLTVLTVIWALGWAMIVLAALVHLPTRAVVAFGVVLIAAHNLLDPIAAADLGQLAPLWSVLHTPGVILPGPDHVVFVAYPLIPWIGVTAVGYGLGAIYTWDVDRRKALLLRLGLGLVAAFVLLRAINVYGDPVSWSSQRSPVFTALSFLNANKYPPSLLFLLMTLGPAMLLLRAVDSGTPRVLRPALIIGKVPLFYFLTHLALIHLLAVVVCYIRYGEAHWMFESPTLGQYPITQPPGWPSGLPVVYMIWIGVVVALYPLCRWFAGVKQRRTDAWLSYL